MAEQNIVQGLFGMTPEAYQQQRDAEAYKRAAAFGQMESIKVHDVQIDSPQIALFRQGMELAKSKGLNGKEAYTFAVRYANLRKFGLETGESQ